jgi:hypothetical protein
MTLALSLLAFFINCEVKNTEIDVFMFVNVVEFQMIIVTRKIHNSIQRKLCN